MPFVTPRGTAPLPSKATAPPVHGEPSDRPVTRMRITNRAAPLARAADTAPALQGTARATRSQWPGTLTERIQRLGVPVLPIRIGPVTHAAVPWNYAKPVAVGTVPYLPSALCAGNRCLQETDFPFPPCHGAPCAHDTIRPLFLEELADPGYRGEPSTHYRVTNTPAPRYQMSARIQAEMAEERQREHDAPCNWKRQPAALSQAVSGIGSRR